MLKWSFLSFLFQNFIFITDQIERAIRIYNKTDESFQGQIRLQNSVPYDIMMYDGKFQPGEQKRKRNTKLVLSVFQTFN